MSLRRFESFLIFIYGLSSLSILFILAPLIALYLIPDSKTLLESLYTNPVLAREAWVSLITTFEASVISTSILLVISIPLAYMLARYEFKGRGLIESIIDMPLLTPHVIAGIMLLAAFGRMGLVSRLFNLSMGIEDTFLGIILVMMFVSIPIMVDTIKIGISSVDIKLEYVARSLGASKARVFKDIVLPLSVRSILAGYILSWARAVSEVGALLIVAYYPKTANIVIYEWFLTYGLKYAASLSIVLMTIFIAIFTALRLIVGGLR